MSFSSEAGKGVSGRLAPSSLPSSLQGAGDEDDIAPLEFKAMELPSSKIMGGRAGNAGHGGAGEEDVSAVDRHARSERERVAAELGAARLAGRMEGREEAEDEFEGKVEGERMQVVKACEGFRSERDRYFGAVEAEVVKLALAIAARVLQREVKLDPMLLQAVVKVALGKVAEESGTVLRVPEEDAVAWRVLMASEGAGVAEVSGDARLTRGECVLETVVGRVELGIGAQLEEIEKGFFDLLQQRPG